MRVALLALLPLLAGGQEPRIALDSPLLPARGSAVWHGTATATWEGGAGVEVLSSWLESGAWALRDSAGLVLPLAEERGEPFPIPLPPKSTLNVELDLVPALKRCAVGEGWLLFRPERGGEWKPLRTLQLAREVTSKEVDFWSQEAVSTEALSRVRVQMEVAVGDRPLEPMVLGFWPEAAPVTVRNFLRYAAEGFYDGQRFHRILKGYVVQGGCPRGDGKGQGPHAAIPGEFNLDMRYRHQRGVISMARTEDPNSATCQFFLCHGDVPALDGHFASFGRLVAGEKALDELAAVRTRNNKAIDEVSEPVEPCRILKMRVFLTQEP